MYVTGAHGETAPPTGDIANLLNNVGHYNMAPEHDDDDNDVFEDTTQNTPVMSPVSSVREGLDVNQSIASSTAGEESQDSQDEGTTHQDETRQQRFHLKSVGKYLTDFHIAK